MRARWRAGVLATAVVVGTAGWAAVVGGGPANAATLNTTTRLALAKKVIIYGQETVEKLTASVSHVGSVYATGKVEVKSGASIVCTITLSKGVGSCTLTAKRLLPRGYHLVAAYLGNGNYLPSTSAAKALMVFTPVD